MTKRSQDQQRCCTCSHNKLSYCTNNSGNKIKKFTSPRLRRNNTVLLIILIKNLGLNRISQDFTLLNIINLYTAHNLRNLCTNLLHISLEFLFIKTKLENLNLSTHIVIGNTLLIET